MLKKHLLAEVFFLFSSCYNGKRTKIYHNLVKQVTDHSRSLVGLVFLFGPDHSQELFPKVTHLGQLRGGSSRQVHHLGFQYAVSR